MSDIVQVVSNASALVLAWWTGVGLALAGIGALVQRALRAAPGEPGAWLLAFWLGFAVTLFALQLWQFFLPVDGRALVALATLGAFGLLWNARAAWVAVVASVRKHPGSLVVFGVVAVWLANLALVGPRNGDSGMYHIPTVRWLAEYAIIPGLGNLHSRLAFNQSYFLYVAMLDVAAFSHRSSHVANGLLLLALFARVISSIGNLLRRGQPWAAHDVFFGLFAPAAVTLALDINLTSPTPDFAVFVLGVVLSGHLLEFLETRSPRAHPDLDFVSLTLLATAGVTMKLSFAMLGLLTVVIGAARWRRGWRDGSACIATTVRAVSAIVGLGLVPWMARGVVMSGYPLFPSVVAAFPVDWRVPAEAAHGEAEFIRVWPCSPWQGLRDPAWLWAFLKSAGWTGLELRIPATIAIAAAAALLPASWVRRRRAQQTQVPAVILIPTAAALVFWFVMAPRPRFAGAALWLLAVQLALLVVDRACPPRRRTGALAACAASLAGACAFLLTSPSLVSGLSEFGIHSPPRLTTVHLTSGLTVNVPDHEMCWDAPLPCSPFVNPALRLRREGDPASGFRLDPSVQDIDDDLIDPAVRTRRPQ